MRASLVALMIALAACSKTPSPPVQAGPPAASHGYRISGPYAHGSLAVFLIHSKDAPSGDLNCITLEEGFRNGSVKITEKAEGAEVNALEVENRGDHPLYLQAGDTVKGGNQDRTIAVDAIIPPRSGKRSLEAFCVEPGRWATRGEPSALACTAAFEEAAVPVATREQKLAVRLEKSQEKVWSAGKQVNERLAQSGGAVVAGATFALEEARDSYVLAVEDPVVQKKLAECLASLEGAPADKADVVGAAFCVGEAAQNVEIYPATGLFRKLWPKLLRSAAIESLTKSTPGGVSKPPSEAALHALLERTTGRPGKVEVRADGQVVRIYEFDGGVLFDSEAEGKLIHRQLIPR